MKLLLACATLLIISTTGYTQRDNEFQIRLGGGIAAYATEWNTNYTLNTPFGTYNFSDSGSDGAVTVHMPLEFRYEVFERLNVGLDMKFGRYIYDPEEDNTGKSNGFGSIGLAAEFTALNKSNTRLYLGLCVNTSWLTLHEKNIDDNGNSVTNEVNYRGPGVKLNAGFIQFFGNSPIGINTNIGYDTHNFEIHSVNATSNGNTNSINGFSGKLKTSGFDIALGLIFRLR